MTAFSPRACQSAMDAQLADYLDDDARQEAFDEEVAERTEQLVKERMRQVEPVRWALYDWLFEDQDPAADALATFFAAVALKSDTDDFAEAAIVLYQSLRNTVVDGIQRDASTDAHTEVEKRIAQSWRDEAEARNLGREAA